MDMVPKRSRGVLYWVGMTLFAVIVLVSMRLVWPTASRSEPESVTSPPESRLSQTLIDNLTSSHIQSCRPAIEQQVQDEGLAMSSDEISQYCACVADRYYSDITQGEFDEHITERRLPPRIAAIRQDIQNECSQSIARHEQPVRNGSNEPENGGGSFGPERRAASESAYVSISPRAWLTLELPTNWRIQDDSMTVTVAALLEAHGSDPTEALDSLSAWLPSPASGESIARMNIRFYPDHDLPHNDELIGISASDFAEFDRIVEQDIREGVQRIDGELIEWHGSELTQIDDKLFIVTTYVRDLSSNPLGDVSRVHLHRYWGGEQSFTLTTACRVDACPLTEPILEHMQSSLRIE